MDYNLGLTEEQWAKMAQRAKAWGETPRGRRFARRATMRQTTRRLDEATGREQL